MQFEKDKTSEKFGEKVGFFAAYMAFTAIIFFILTYLGKLPAEWKYFHVAWLVLALTLIGFEIKGMMK